ncbi:hypothetical protein L1887_32099 [Cichorium endivia]|nr:hypothetical protein L1887_32099 [Cichorium endivia]
MCRSSASPIDEPDNTKYSFFFVSLLLLSHLSSFILSPFLSSLRFHTLICIQTYIKHIIYYTCESTYHLHLLPFCCYPFCSPLNRCFLFLGFGFSNQLHTPTISLSSRGCFFRCL